ncbi:hypothetical protein HYZ64_00835 [Candidatus Berkelbacteria bacterium]|nr:hypothetical protein [Candidatus Berkelbacteria bacterium]
MSQKQRKQMAVVARRTSRVKRFFAFAMMCLTIVLIVGVFWRAYRIGLRRELAEKSPPAKSIRQYSEAELEKLDQKYSAEDIQKMFGEWIKPMLEQAGRSDPVPAIRKSINELAKLAKGKHYQIVMSGQFARQNGKIRPYGLAHTEPEFVDREGKTVQKGQVVIHLPAFEDYLPFPDRFNDALLSTLSHEYYHLEFDQPRVDRAGFIEGEALVWGKQVEDMLIPMEQTGRFLRPEQQQAIIAWKRYKDQPGKWRAWIASMHPSRNH